MEWAAAIALALFFLIALSASAHESTDDDPIAKYQAAYIFNLMKFTTWPEDRFEKPTSPYVVAVVDNPTLYKLLSRAVKDKVIDSRAVQVTQVEYVPPPAPDKSEAETSPDPAEGGSKPAESDQDGKPADRNTFVESISSAHIVFLGRDEEMVQDDLAALCTEASALFVSDAKDFALNGGMVGLVVSDRHLAFEINLERTEIAEIRISSKLLRLATIIKSKEGR